jgi:hypothetical protein
MLQLGQTRKSSARAYVLPSNSDMLDAGGTSRFVPACHSLFTWATPRSNFRRPAILNPSAASSAIVNLRCPHRNHHGAFHGLANCNDVGTKPVELWRHRLVHVSGYARILGDKSERAAEDLVDDAIVPICLSRGATRITLKPFFSITAFWAMRCGIGATGVPVGTIGH